MFILYGRRTVCIKREEDNNPVCENCKSTGVDIAIYREYFHLFFIPVAPISPKYAKINCSHCGAPNWLKDNAKLYEQATRTPIYFYSGLIIVGLITLLVLVASFY